MAPRFTHLLVAVVGLATVCSVAAASWNAWGDEMNAVAHTPAELLQWHSGLTVTSGSCVKPEWKSTLSATGQEDAAALHVILHGGAGLPDVAKDGFDYSPDTSGAPKGSRRSVRDPAPIQGRSTGTAR